MNANSCCEVAPREWGPQPLPRRKDGKHSATFARRCVKLAGWLVPSATLAVLPKCPMCFAAHVALGTGVGLSVSAATYFRVTIVILCVTSLLYLATKAVRSLLVPVPTLRQANTVFLEALSIEDKATGANIVQQDGSLDARQNPYRTSGETLANKPTA